jgi:poly-beta-1,6-N-acetyl-D-glucosamine synthase
MGTVAIHPAPTPPAPEAPPSPVGPESIADPVLVLRQAGVTGGMNRSYVPGPRSHKRRRYITVRGKFVLAAGFAAVWVAFSVWLALPWLAETATVVGLVPAIVIVTLLAFIPGGLVSFLLVSILLDHQPRLTETHPTVGVTVVIAARNESAVVGETIKYMAAQDYGGPLHVIVVDNGSTDDTASLARQAGSEHGLSLRVMYESTPGKSHALNRGLEVVDTPLVITVDADTVLHRSAIRLLVARYASAPDDVVAVAGSVLVRNSRAGFWARVQEWDYFLGIASVKRMQGLFQGTLVAQGAFSLYETAAVREVGSWPDAIGEDIVLTWKLLRGGRRVYYEPKAVAFTSAPEEFRTFTRQRSRWARGMIEGLRTVPPWHQPRRLTRALTAVNLAIPFLDTAYVFAWLPGLVLACFGYFWLVGPMTIAVLPLTAIVYGVLFHRQWHDVFKPLGLVVRKNWLAFAAFLLVYQVVMSTVSVKGYTEELLGRRRRWK